ncbi:TetR/AcrR family transcriptional regulator [Rhizobium sp. NPDC090275]|uniref:TetR/AcrR family transcriptional regulator n=1 Tax=Rhizobium sp. NPDC090275 TaxID=3364498 RepID=UPI00383AE1AE
MTQLKTTAEERPYHHGDLQRAILNAAFDVLSESQSTEFSLRELARRAGVSHNAPYKHFADKREMLAAVSAVGFERLADEMHKAQVGKTEPRERLMLLMRAYVRSGVTNPALYRLMFGGLLTEQGNNRPAIERTAAFEMRALIVSAICDGAIGRAIADTEEENSRIDTVVLALWSQVHGLTLLLIDGLVGPVDAADKLVDIMLQALIDGLSTLPSIVPASVWIGPQTAASQ